jgi:hypothetical protein
MQLLRVNHALLSAFILCFLYYAESPVLFQHPIQLMLSNKFFALPFFFFFSRLKEQLQVHTSASHILSCAHTLHQNMHRDTFNTPLLPDVSYTAYLLLPLTLPTAVPPHFDKSYASIYMQTSIQT